jgi:hypothetical protein
VAGRLDFPIAPLATTVFPDYMTFRFEAAARLRRTVLGISFAELIPNWSEETLSTAMVEAAQAQFAQCIQVVSRDVRFVCLICDARTVVNSKVVHAAFTNPSRIDDIVTLPPFENLNWDRAASQMFFRQSCTTYAGDVPAPSEICGVVCDNFPAQVAGLRHFLAGDDGLWAGIIHVGCLNHVINLVFARVIREGIFLQIAEDLPRVVRALNSEVAVAITGRQCPKIIRTRWVYLVEVLAFIINHSSEVHEVVHIADTEVINQIYRPVYLFLFHLSLFSWTMET